MTGEGKRNTIIMVCVLVQQLRVWLKHSRDLGYMTKEFKYLSGLLLTTLNRFHSFLFSGKTEEDDEVFEHSAQVSEVIEGLVSLQPSDLQRVIGLINKLKKEKP